MTILEIECFLSICEHKTISRAAEALYITQPSLSSRLKTLERELGGELFVRKKGAREMSLTDAGKEFYKLALQYEELITKMGQIFGKQVTKLRVSSLNSLDTFLLPQVVLKLLTLVLLHSSLVTECTSLTLPVVHQSGAVLLLHHHIPQTLTAMVLLGQTLSSKTTQSTALVCT